MQLKFFKQKILELFKEAQIANAKMEVDWIFAKIANISATRFFVNPNILLEKTQVDKINFIAKQRILGKPLAYLLKSAEFYGLEFLVNSSVLIPRQDTESLIDFVLASNYLQTLEKRLALADKKIQVLDMCTGSGVIGLTLKKNRPNWELLLSDISSEALDVARKNSELLQAPVDILQSDLFSQIPSNKKFTIIVANPPYIDKTDPHLSTLKFEPQLALVADNKGLDILQKIIFASKSFLVKDGFLILEHGYKQSGKVREFLQKEGFYNINTGLDLQNNPRFTYGVFKNKLI